MTDSSPEPCKYLPMTIAHILDIKSTRFTVVRASSEQIKSSADSANCFRIGVIWIWIQIWFSKVTDARGNQLLVHASPPCTLNASIKSTDWVVTAFSISKIKIEENNAKGRQLQWLLWREGSIFSSEVECWSPVWESHKCFKICVSKPGIALISHDPEFRKSESSDT